MDKLKNAFMDFIHGEKSRVIFVAIQVAVGFLFWLGLFFPYVVDDNLINGRLAASSLPGGWIYSLVIIVLIVIFAYETMMNQLPLANKLYKALAIVSTLIFLYALLFTKVGIPDAKNGFGKILEFLMIGCYGLILLGEKFLYKMIYRWAPLKEGTPNQETVDKTQKVASKNDDLFSLAKELMLTDERGLFAKIVISYSTISKVAVIATGGMTAAGNDGFVGIYQNQLVCFDANTWGTKPHKERFRFSFDVIDSHEIKKGAGGLNNQFLIKAGAHQFKLYFMNKRRQMIEMIHDAISHPQPTEHEGEANV